MLIHELRRGQFWSWFSNLRGPCTSFPVDSHVGCHDKCDHTLACGLFWLYVTRSLLQLSLLISPHQRNIPSAWTGADRPGEKLGSIWNASLLTPVSYHTAITTVKNSYKVCRYQTVACNEIKMNWFWSPEGQKIYGTKKYIKIVMKKLIPESNQVQWRPRHRGKQSSPFKVSLSKTRVG